MSARLVVLPVWELTCQGKGCPATYRTQSTHPLIRQQESRSPWELRNAARKQGWQVRVPRVRGTRDLCPDCGRAGK